MLHDFDNLIKVYCPEGVEFATLFSVARILNGYAFQSSKYSDDGIRVIRISDVQKGKISSKDLKYYPLENIHEIERYLLKENDLVMSLTGNVGRVAMLSQKDLPAGLNQRVACIRGFEDIILDRYLFHFFDQTLFEIEATSNATGGGQKNLSTNWLGNYKIPVPPLEVQKEIVKILDRFAELVAELEAELEARKKQYEYYRTNFYNVSPDKIKWKSLGEVGTFLRGKRFVRTDMIDEGYPCIHYGEMYTHYNIKASKTKSFVSNELAKKLRVANPNDVIIVSAGETIEDIGLGVAWLGESDVVIHDACFAFKHNQNPKYISHFLQTDLFHSQIKRFITSAKISSINADGLSKAKIPLPSLEEQNRIVDILDKFDALVNDISSGIPAEIQARRKQYEYYRNKLLTFNKLENA